MPTWQQSSYNTVYRKLIFRSHRGIKTS